MKFIAFFDRVFYYYYFLAKSGNSEPQFFPIIVITIAQTMNVMSVLIVLFHLLHMNYFWEKLEVFFMAVIGVLLFVNFLVYQIRDRKDIILNKINFLPFSFKIVSFLYFILSVSFPVLIVYLINLFEKN